MRTLDGRAVIVLATLLGVAGCSTPDKRPPESAGRPMDAAQMGGLSALGDAEGMDSAGAGRARIERLKRV